MAKRLEDCYRFEFKNPASGGPIYEGRYYISGGFNVAIVAMVTGAGAWVAYLGAMETTAEEYLTKFLEVSNAADYDKDLTIVEAVSYGAKLSEEDARYYFEVDLPYRH